MLCVHGGGAHAHWFDFVAPGFSANFHVRALDQRGHGDSAWAEPPAYAYTRYAADLAEVVEKLDLRDFVLIGHSMGGMVSLVYAASHPGRLSRLIIVDTTMHMGGERLSAMRNRGTREGSNYATREELVARYRLLPAGTRAPETIRHLAQTAGANPRTAGGGTSSIAMFSPRAKARTACCTGTASAFRRCWSKAAAAIASQRRLWPRCRRAARRLNSLKCPTAITTSRSTIPPAS
jgi:pimeloyl-ACP methyl ester carboxylesterase